GSEQWCQQARRVEGESRGVGAAAGVVHRHEVGVSQVRLLEFTQLTRKTLVVNRQRDFKIEPQAARIEIQGTEEARATVHCDRFCMQQSAVKLRDAYAGREQLVFVRLARQAHQQRIDARGQD